MKNYETEANASNTDAYREHEQKTKNYIKEKWAEVNEKLMTMFAEFATCKQSGAYAYSNEARHLSPSFRHTLQPTTILAHLRYLQDLARCMWLTSDSKRISTSTERELLYLFLNRLPFLL